MILQGKSAVITGGVRGIGKAIAEEFCKEGANVLLCYRSNDDAANKTVEELKKYGTRVELLKGDVADAQHGEEAAKKAAELFGKVDILVNNAGITKDKLMMRMTPSDFDQVVQANLNGSFYFLRAFAPLMIKQKSGRIINISSIVGLRGNPGQVNYSASKAGIIGMTLSAAKELGRRGITVNAVAPGYIETEMTDVLTEEQKGKMMEMISLGRMGKAEDVAKTVTFLASENASYITGQVIGVDGGMTI
ncbi:3-oxoacyl-[acyl-carrier-protein] reductase [Clostridiales bacterium BAD-6]|jgi:3-oxoacyl-[acyl-carrier protein] reductase|uniref:3-oxoacyl-[acyl-carrier-protein] reductase n=1 Tax=Sinanaerobacter chloroacetimidivorans TaxID=2818044 RepID=A0A8J8B1N1_9FIRM|nr:3-oxoacyl-[acyl-carrier-protein] reductase [Sinanaerobacter chloroacetimidivorans]MBR0597907.1 3-oxoacyl-[acyl-carrier-protein] reductase [Sinanaerobacter chloroacetimidivorans]